MARIPLFEFIVHKINVHAKNHLTLTGTYNILYPCLLTTNDNILMKLKETLYVIEKSTI